MKPSFHAKILNSPFEDPMLYIRLLREGRALLFDSGFTTGLSARDILKITDIFVSHAHIDHFIGFDSILRIHLRRDGCLKFYGPEGFINCVKGKLSSYTWNLTGDYPLVIEAYEVNKDILRKAVFKAKHSFMPEDSGSTPFNGILLENSFFRIKGAVFDHRIPCLAFSLEEDYHINIDKAKLKALNLPVGPWLGELKKAIREKRTDNAFTIDGNKWNYSELKEIAGITKGQKLTYIVDMLGSEENIEKAVVLAKNSDILYIETYFLDKDKERARERFHLTAKEAGRIAREAEVKRMETFHFSPKYMDNPDELIREAEEEFKKV
ncbi:MAG: MBL fold metallo-hydrolase [Nitrospirae bacterium]|nr:MBL fold metallo-hydrolase [Nitrospirota bacterium]